MMNMDMDMNTDKVMDTDECSKFSYVKQNILNGIFILSYMFF